MNSQNLEKKIFEEFPRILDGGSNNGLNQLIWLKFVEDLCKSITNNDIHSNKLSLAFDLINSIGESSLSDDTSSVKRVIEKLTIHDSVSEISNRYLKGNSLKIFEKTPLIQQRKYTKELLNNFPRVKNYFKDEENIDEIVYEIWGYFSINLSKDIDRRQLSEKELVKAFSLLNSMGESEDDQIQTLLSVGALENLETTDYTINVAKSHLKGEALNAFIIILEYNSRNLRV